MMTVPPGCEDVYWLFGDLVSENASDFPEVIARTRTYIVLRPCGLARPFSQDAWQERSSQERKYVLSVLRIDKQPLLL